MYLYIYIHTYTHIHTHIYCSSNKAKWGSNAITWEARPVPLRPVLKKFTGWLWILDSWHAKWVQPVLESPIRKIGAEPWEI